MAIEEVLTRTCQYDLVHFDYVDGPAPETFAPMDGRVGMHLCDSTTCLLSAATTYVGSPLLHSPVHISTPFTANSIIFSRSELTGVRSLPHPPHAALLTPLSLALTQQVSQSRVLIVKAK